MSLYVDFQWSQSRPSVAESGEALAASRHRHRAISSSCRQLIGADLRQRAGAANDRRHDCPAQPSDTDTADQLTPLLESTAAITTTISPAVFPTCILSALHAPPHHHGLARRPVGHHPHAQPAPNIPKVDPLLALAALADLQPHHRGDAAARQRQPQRP